MSFYTTHTREAILLISTLGLFCTAPSCVDPPEPVPPTPPSGGTAGTGGAPTGGVAPVTGGTAGTGGQASVGVKVCQKLEAIGCPVAENCSEQVDKLQEHEEKGWAVFDEDCLLNAGTVNSVKACESMPCEVNQ